MVLYFSGTGNSAYVAEKIAQKLQDTAVSINDKIRGGDHERLHSRTPWVFVAPTYSWQLPRTVRDWILQTDFHGSRQAWFVLTCGGSIGGAGKYAEELCDKKGFRYMGCRQIVMPENYVAMFAVPDREEAGRIVKEAEPLIGQTGELIREGKPFPKKKEKWLDRLLSGPVNRAFYRFVVHAKKFYSTEECIGCGHCAKVCPLRNVTMEKGRPKWGDHCTHCMACICECPKAAIEYGNKSKGKPRYRCPVSAK